MQAFFYFRIFHLKQDYKALYMPTYLSKIIIFLIGSLPFFTPIRPDLGWFYVAPDILKTLWGVMGVLVVIFFWLVFSYRKSEIVIQKSNIYLPLLVFITWCYVTLFWVEDGYLATIMLAQFTSVALMFFIVNNLIKRSAFYSIFNMLIFSMTLVSIIGLMQFYFRDNTLIYNFFGQSAVPGSTFVNKNMASHFLVMVLPLNLILLLKETSKKKIAFYSISITISLWYLIFIAARQAYLAFSIEFILLALFLVLDYWKNRKKAIYCITTFKIYKVAIAMLIIIFLSVVSNLVNSGSNKLQKLQSINIEGGNARIPAWINTIELIKDNFLTGVGVGQWPEVYPMYYDKVKKDVIFNEKTRLKRLHNDYIETFSNVGFIGFSVLIWMSFLILSKFFRIILNPYNPDRFGVFSIGLGLVGFCTVAFFSFPVRVYLPIFLVLVFFALIEISYRNSDKSFNIKNKRLILSILVLFSIISSYIGEKAIKWAKAENYYFLSKSFESVGMFTEALYFSDLALRNNKLSPSFYSIAGRLSLATSNLEKAEVLIKKSIDISPFNIPNLLNLAIVYNVNKNVVMELKVLEFILSFDEKNVRALAQLTFALYKEKEYKKAMIVYNRLKDAFTYFNGRNGFGPYHDVVSLVAINVGDHNYARYIYQDEINKKKLNKNEIYVKLGALEYYYLKNKKNGVKWLKKALEISPDMPKNSEIKALIEEYESSVK
jgi:tetratricopeptide (TPR) repeat protein